ncbi:MAG: hypothetical protein HOP18_10055 [Deltaproteobacteria bacterium]|nr:hypothetical protein [Deltaproteobacteria bacterium]
MPRRARLSLPGMRWHLIQRGNNRPVYLYAEEDYRFYLDRLTELSQQFGYAGHAYALMTNHVHLRRTPERTGSAPLTMKHLGQHYVQYINRTDKRSGTLWEGRFRSCLTPSTDDVLACDHSIAWTSYRANGGGFTPCWPTRRQVGQGAKTCPC